VDALTEGQTAVIMERFDPNQDAEVNDVICISPHDLICFLFSGS
jgi:hypothetical protein